MAPGSRVEDVLAARTPELVKGAKWVRPGKDGYTSLPSDEVFDRSASVTKAIVQATRDGFANPTKVANKAISPDFRNQYGGFLQAGSNPMLTQLAAQVQQLSAEIGKNFTTGSPLSSGLVPFDLVAPARLIYPVFSPLRNKIPRTPGQGTSRRAKVLTGISGSNTPSGSGKAQAWGVSELTNFATWPGTLPAAGSQSASDINIPYKFFGISESISWLAQMAGQGFEDVSALANLILMQEAMLAEEHTLIAGTGTNIPAPTVSGTARAAGSGEAGLSGVTTNVYLRVTTTTRYGESASSTVVSVAASNGQVIDVTITPNGAGEQFNVYAATGAADPGAAATHIAKTGLGGTKFTLQGAIPTTGVTAPTADSGTGSSTNYEGLLSILTGAAVTNGVYPSGFSAGYVNQAVQNTLGLSVLETALTNMYTAWKADPEDLFVEASDSRRLGDDVLKNGSGTNYQLRIEQDQMTGIIHGGAVSQVVNPVTRKLVNVAVHPWFNQGTAMLMSWSLPLAFNNVSNVFENVMVQDYLSVAWPVIDPSFRFSLFMYGALVAYAAQYCGVLQGLQVSATGPWS